MSVFAVAIPEAAHQLVKAVQHGCPVAHAAFSAVKAMSEQRGALSTKCHGTGTCRVVITSKCFSEHSKWSWGSGLILVLGARGTALPGTRCLLGSFFIVPFHFQLLAMEICTLAVEIFLPFLINYPQRCLLGHRTTNTTERKFRSSVS